MFWNFLIEHRLKETRQFVPSWILDLTYLVFDNNSDPLRRYYISNTKKKKVSVCECPIRKWYMLPIWQKYFEYCCILLSFDCIQARLVEVCMKILHFYAGLHKKIQSFILCWYLSKYIDYIKIKPKFLLLIENTSK